MLHPLELADQLHTQLGGISSGIDTMFDDPSTGYIIVDGLIGGLLCPSVGSAFDFSLILSDLFDDVKISLLQFGDFLLDSAITSLPFCQPAVARETLFGLRLQAGVSIDCMHGNVDFFAEIVTPPSLGDLSCGRQPSVTPFIMDSLAQFEIAKGGILTAALGAQAI